MNIRIWGLAAGRGTTKDAARGAFTWREYAGEKDIPRSDWLQIICIEKNNSNPQPQPNENPVDQFKPARRG
jgi:hypothetical protein